MLLTLSVCSLSVRRCLPVFAFQRWIVSPPSLAIVLPSEENATLVFPNAYCSDTRSSLPVLASHKWIVESQLALAIVVPLGE